MHQYSCQRQIEFSDTDLGGIVHFSRFFVFMETAEHEFQRAAGVTIHGEVEGRKIGWPRVSASCEFKSPVRFGDVLDIEVRILRKGEKSLTYGFEFRLADRLVASGRITAACCDVGGKDGMKAIPIPAAIADLIEEAPEG